MEGRAKARVQEARELEWTLLPPGEVSQIEGITLQKDLCPIWDRVWGFQAKPDDLFIASYPKSGMSVSMTRGKWNSEHVSSFQDNGVKVKGGGKQYP
ncbi:hypothetical protein MC885_009316 [Smutsia gigantea]|nr:hypothetical protein MC885_009316 [Smutsia gigantea]